MFDFHIFKFIIEAFTQSLVIRYIVFYLYFVFVVLSKDI